MSGDRFDPQMVLYNRKTNAFKYPTFPLKHFLYASPMYGANESGIIRKNTDEPRYIRITDIDEFGNLNEDIGATAENIEDKYYLDENDLLFARSGATVGKTYLHKGKTYPCFFAGYMIKFKIDPAKINPYFVFTYTQLNTYKEWVKAVQRASAQPNINAEEYKNFPIPLPPLDIQNQIIAKMDEAYRQKADNEARAQAILDGIDGYLLSELGIDAPDLDDKTVAKRVFTRKMSEVSGKRFDPSSYADGFSFIDTVFDLVTFSDYLFIDPYSKMDETLEATFLPMEKISDEYGEADTTLSRNMEGSKGYTKFQENDLLWSKITPCMENGKSAVVRHLQNGIGFGSTEYFVFRPKRKDINIDYIHALLRLKAFRQTATRFFTGTSGHQRVSSDFFKTLKIPLPFLEKQNEIAAHVESLRAEAKRLRNEAAQQFEAAKAEVEKMVLGN